jgi:hypothetical protein
MLTVVPYGDRPLEAAFGQRTGYYVLAPALAICSGVVVILHLPKTLQKYKFTTDVVIVSITIVFCVSAGGIVVSYLQCIELDL